MSVRTRDIQGTSELKAMLEYMEYTNHSIQEVKSGMSGGRVNASRVVRSRKISRVQ